MQPADAVPKKRGPKTDVLEALLKRVDGLEKRLVSEGKSDDLTEFDPSTTQDVTVDTKLDLAPTQSRSPHESSPNLSHATNHATNHATQLMSPIEPRYYQHSFPIQAGRIANSNQHPHSDTLSRPTSGHLLCQNTWKTLLHPG